MGSVVAAALVAYYVRRDHAGARQILHDAVRRRESEQYFTWLGCWEPSPKRQIEWFRRAVTVMPHYARGYVDLGSAHARAGDLRAAVEDYTRALRINPALGIAWPHVDGGPILSDRDRAAPSLADAQAAGLLPTWEETRAFAEELRRR